MMRHFRKICIAAVLLALPLLQGCAAGTGGGGGTGKGTGGATPVITSTSVPAGQTDTQYSAQLSASGGATPYSWSITSGQLPAGLALDASLGTIGGAPTEAGVFSITVQVQDSSNQTATQTISLNISQLPPLTVTTQNPPGGNVSMPYDLALQASGGTLPYIWSSISGVIPPGLSVQSNGVLSGVPATAGTYQFTVKVVDSSAVQQNATATLTIVIGPTLASPQFTIVTNGLPNGVAGTPYQQMLQAFGGTAPYNWLLTAGGLPSGLTLAADGTISGTPGATGTFSFTVQVADFSLPAQVLQQQYSITIASPPPPPGKGTSPPTLIITAGSLPNGTVGTSYAAAVTISGGTAPYTWTLTAGTLPAGLTFSSSTGVIAGTPTQTSQATITVQVQDSSLPSQSASHSYTFSIIATQPAKGFVIASTSVPNGQVGVAYSTALLSSGGVAPISWTLLGGQLPPGVNLSSSGMLTGIPTTTGNFTFQVQATDSTAKTATQSFLISIASAPPPPGNNLAILSAGVANGQIGVPYSTSLQASGGTTPYNWVLTTGQLPPGLTLTSDGLISGTPTSPGTFTFSVKVTDTSAPQQNATQTYTASIGPLQPPPVTISISTTGLPNGTIGTSYSATMQATGGTAPLTWSISSGQVPGLSMNSAGVISGTPTTPGNYIFTVQVVDSSSPTQSTAKVFAISVPQTPNPLTVSNASFPAAGTTVWTPSDAPQVISVTNTTGQDITFVVDHVNLNFNHVGYGGLMETGSVVTQRNYGNSCQPRTRETASLANGASCQFNVYLLPTATGAVAGTVRVEYIPKPTNPLVSISRGGGVRTVVTQNPVANLQVGFYVTIIGTPDDPCCNPPKLADSFNDTRKILSVTDSTHFTIDDYDSSPLSPVSNQGFISDAQPAYDSYLATANVTGIGNPEPPFDATHPPALPNGINADDTGTVMDTTYTAPASCSGGVISDAPTLTSRLAGASCGEVLCVQAGTAIPGRFKLPNIAACSNYTYLISANYTNLAFPAAGTRVQPSDEPNLGILQANSPGPVLTLATGASYWRIVGMELTRVTNGTAGPWGPLYMTNPSLAATSAATINHHIICDRCLIRRQDTDTTAMVGGVEVDGNYMAVIDSYIANIGIGEYQAISNCNGNGPIKIVNNYLESSGEVVIFGGCDPAWIGSYPQDVEIRNNLFDKRLVWQGAPGSDVKNILEFKIGQRVLVTGNILRHNWAASQDGSAIVLEPSNQYGSNVTDRVQDITFDYNILQHSTHSFNHTATSYMFPSAPVRRILIRNMLMQDIGGINSPWVTGGWTCPSVFSCGWTFNNMAGHPGGAGGAKYGPDVPAQDIHLDHLTNFSAAGVLNMSLMLQGVVNVLITNSINMEGGTDHGFIGAGIGTGSVGINAYMVNPTFTTNVFLGNPADASLLPTLDPSGSGFTAFWWEDNTTIASNPNLFADWTNCDGGTYSTTACALKPGSYYQAGGSRQASDGKQVGADINGLNTRTACVTSGAACNPLP